MLKPLEATYERAKRVDRKIDELRWKYGRDEDLVAAAEHLLRIESCLVQLEFRCSSGAERKRIRKIIGAVREIHCQIGRLLAQCPENEHLVEAAEHSAELVAALKRVKSADPMRLGVLLAHPKPEKAWNQPLPVRCGS